MDKEISNIKNKSIWINDRVKNEKMDRLDKDIECDVLIIGGGIAGLSVAYQLIDSKREVVLIDSARCCMGTTSKNTGKLTWMQDLVYGKLTTNYSEKVAKLYYDSQIDAINEVKRIIKDNRIECHLKGTDAYVFSDKGNDYSKYGDEINFYKKYGIRYELLDNLPIDYKCQYALKTEKSYVFNPYEYMVGLKNIVKDKIKIYENTRCLSVDKDNDGYLVRVSGEYKIKSKYVVVACHYPPFIIPFFTPFKTSVEKFYIGYGEVDKIKNIQMISSGKHTVSMRYYQDGDKNYFIYGRRNHSVAVKLDVRDDLRELACEYKKQIDKDLKCFYHTHDLMTYDSMPFIGEVDKNLYICTGFNKWGNTNGTMAGMLIKDLICGNKNRYKNLFNPHRGLSFDKIKKLLIYNTMVGSRYVVNKISSSMSYYNDNVRIEYIDGKKCGIYVDDKGTEHKVSNICPHMKCNLIFNYVDKTWDCPCHGSRFTVDGDVLMGPSVYSIRLDK